MSGVALNYHSRGLSGFWYPDISGVTLHPPLSNVNVYMTLIPKKGKTSEIRVYQNSNSWNYGQLILRKDCFKVS